MNPLCKSILHFSIYDIYKKSKENRIILVKYKEYLKFVLKIAFFPNYILNYLDKLGKIILLTKF